MGCNCRDVKRVPGDPGSSDVSVPRTASPCVALLGSRSASSRHAVPVTSATPHMVPNGRIVEPLFGVAAEHSPIDASFAYPKGAPSGNPLLTLVQMPGPLNRGRDYVRVGNTNVPGLEGLRLPYQRFDTPTGPVHIIGGVRFHNGVPCGPGCKCVVSTERYTIVVSCPPYHASFGIMF